MTANETLLKLIELTNKNLEILGMINESFFTKKEHLTTVINDTRYTIPSYIALENKVNHLQAAFNNLVHAPMTGEAYMHFDGNSRVIQMRGFQQGPPVVNLDEQTSLNVPNPQFFTEDTHLFKDMLSPKPYIKLDLSELDDDITKVVVKKIIPYNRDLIDTIYSKNFSILAMDYSIMQAFLTSGNLYKKGVDYDEYDVVYDLPIRRLTCSGEYIVDDVISDEVDDDMNNIIVVQLDENTPAVCTVYDGYTTRNLRKGDILTTWDGSARMVIEDIQQFMHKLTLRVLSGEYLNILPNSKSVDDKISDYSRLRFYRPEDFDSDKYLNLPLEEDQYVYVTIAPLNTRMNTQAQWGIGLYINVDGLETTIINGEGNEEKVSFREYYKDNVKNIGDTINELAAILPAPMTNLSPSEFDSLLNAKPWMTSADGTIDTLQVVQINKHLNEAENIKTIRNLYAQKQQYKVDLTECQNKIVTLTAELSEISFDDMSGSRTMLTAQISDLKAKQNELVASINTAIDAIAQAANDSEVPIEASKFRIRGFVDIDRFLQNNGLGSFKDNIRAVKVRYRYKNPGITELANVSTIGGFLFTEWNNYSAGTRHKVASYSNGHYITSFDDPNPSDNDIKYNQVDIPINQGEQVDIQAKVMWDYGYPFISLESDWSDIVTIKFPQELMADVQVTSIIEENNNDIETYRFENILDNHGITSHINDYVDDQNIRYYHKPESISSGFYTEERRVIPLADKLRDMNTQLASIQDMLLGTHAESMRVSLTVNNIEYVLKPDIDNVVQLSAYNTVPIVGEDELQTDLERANESAAATTFGSITIKNVTDHTLRLFSMVPGARDQKMTDSINRFQRNLNTHYHYAEPFITPITSTQQAHVQHAPSLLSLYEQYPDDWAWGELIYVSPKPTTDTLGGGTSELVWKINVGNKGGGIKLPGIQVISSDQYNTDHNNMVDDKLNTISSGSRVDGLGNVLLKLTMPNGQTTQTFGCLLKQGGENVQDLQAFEHNPWSGDGTIPDDEIAELDADCQITVELCKEGDLSDVNDIYIRLPFQGDNEQGNSVYDPIYLKFNTSSGSNDEGGGSSVTEQVATPQFSPGQGTYTSAQNVSISCATPDATIRYTTDRTNPNESSPIYNSPIIISQNTFLSAVAFKEGMNPSQQNTTYYGINTNSGGGGNTTPDNPNNDYTYDYEGCKQIYVMSPSDVDMISGVNENDTELVSRILKPQVQNQFTTFRIREPYGDKLLGNQGVETLSEQQRRVIDISKGVTFNNSFVYAAPATSNIEDLCIQSDAVQSYMEIGPGDSVTVPVFIGYYMQPENPNCAYTLGFDVRNSLYNDPIYYQVTLAARYNQTFSDLLQSQKASVSNQTNYNPVIRS